MGVNEWAAFRLGRYRSSSDNQPVESSVADTRFFEMFANVAATSGDNRGAYLRTHFTGGGGGETLRAYSVAMAAVATMHGAHVTGEIGAAGSISGLLAGLRATLATATGLTLTAGSASALRLDSDLASTVANMTVAAFIALADNGAQKMPFFLDLTGVVSAATSAWRGTGTVSGFTLGGLRVKMPDGSVGYIPVGASISA